MKCHWVSGFFNYWLLFRIIYRVSRYYTRTRDWLHTRPTYVDLKCMQYSIMGLHMFSVFANNPHQKIHQTWTLTIASLIFCFVWYPDWKIPWVTLLSFVHYHKVIIYIFTQHAKILRYRDCSMSVGGGYQRILLSISW